jgi:hypothetical protein
MRNQYWVKSPKTAIANEIRNKFEEHLRSIESSGYAQMQQDSYDAYYAFNEGGFNLQISRERSNAKIRVNHYKSLLQRIHGMVTNAKLAYTPRARNSDADSMLQADFAKGLLELYDDEKNMGEYTSEMVERGLVCFESFIYAPWDKSQGIEITKDEETGEQILSGDQCFYNLSSFDVAKHPTLKVTPYYIVRLEVNKYDLAAEHPKHADAILSMSSGRNTAEADRLQSPFDSLEHDPEDTVYKYILLHKKTQALPKGRYTEIVGDVVLIDTSMPYKTIPVIRFTPSDVFGSTGGDSPATSLLSLQQAMDKLWGAVTTNNLTAAKSNLWSTTAVDVQQISEGLNNIVSPVKPENLSLAGSSSETYKLIESYQLQEEILSGVNKTARGNPDSAVGTAAGQALMLAQAVEFVSDTQRQYARAASELATIVIHNLQVFATEPRIAYIGGKSRAAYVRQFTNQDIDAVSRVSIDLGNPMTQTISGRYTLATEWTQAGIIKDPAKLTEFLRTGQIDSLTEDQFKDGVLIRNENEEMRKGELPIASIYDIHPNHILDHKQLANDPVFRYNPTSMGILNQHIQEHLALNKQIDPDLAAIIGIPPLPSQSQPQPPSTPEMTPPNMQGQPLPQIPEEAPLQTQEAYQQITDQFIEPEGQ